MAVFLARPLLGLLHFPSPASSRGVPPRLDVCFVLSSPLDEEPVNDVGSVGFGLVLELPTMVVQCSSINLFDQVMVFSGLLVPSLSFPHFTRDRALCLWRSVKISFLRLCPDFPSSHTP